MIGNGCRCEDGEGRDRAMGGGGLGKQKEMNRIGRIGSSTHPGPGPAIYIRTKEKGEFP